MELMNLRRGLMAQMANGTIPAFMNHLESGQFTLASDATSTWVYMQHISLPKGILVYSNAFDEETAKESKPMLGAYAAYYIAGTDALTPSSNGNINIARFAFYLVNWGQNSSNPQNPASLNSRSTNRGFDALNPESKGFHLKGFGTGDYDLKTGVTYNWLAWD